jgi:hypothetical protein
MKVLTLPHAFGPVVAACFAAQALALYVTAVHPDRSGSLCVVAFFIGGFVTDWFSGVAHFGFDYVWPPKFPILGPIAVDFRAHHERPGLDPSAVFVNLTKGSYGALPIACATIAVAVFADRPSFLLVASGMATSIWMLGFHQIHSYAHMGKSIPAEEFNRAVARIVELPTRQEQKEEFRKLFAAVGIPRPVRLLQQCRLFLRPEIHWRHHHTFETDFSSVNGWSDPLMNLIYRPVTRRLKARAEHHEHHDSTSHPTALAS